MEKIELLDGPRRVVELAAQDVVDIHKALSKYVEYLEDTFGGVTEDSRRIRSLKVAVFHLL